MFWQRSLPARVELGDSCYPRRLAGLSLLLTALALALTSLPWWWMVLLWVLAAGVVRRWQPPLVRQLYWYEQQLSVTGRHAQLLLPPYRVVRCGPWLALHTPRGWLHLFADQAPAAQLQPFYQWLWVNRCRR
ncbi:MAG: hypothetical protein R3292_14150 [Alcanivorax sp.]|nr:hypothetical protein [Alcanivorax sp.]